MKKEIIERIEMINLGEAPQGYKKIKSAIIPETWKYEKASNYFSSNTNKKHNGKLTVLSATQDKGIIPRDQVDIDIKYSEESLSSYKQVDIGDFVISLRSFQGGIEYSKFNGIVSPAYTVIKNKVQICAGYYKSYFKTDTFISILNSTIYGIRDGKQIRFDDFSLLRIHYPPLPEQEKINEILSCCDESIKLMENLVEQKRQQKEYLMQNLLNPDSDVRVKGFENSEWETAKFDNLCVFIGNLSIPRDQLTNEGTCYLHYGDIHKSDRTYIVADDYQLMPKFLNERNINVEKYLLYDGDIVFVDASEDIDGVSKYVVISNPNKISFIAGLHTIIARSRNNDMDNTFKRYVFQAEYIKKQFAFYKSGMKVFGLSKTNIAKIQLRLPPIDEQIAIANILSIADREIELLQTGLDAQRQLKKALMQLLLTGKVRCM